MSEPVPIHLAYPPSANSIWRNVGGKTLMSAGYRAWKKAALWEIASQRPAKVLGPYRMTLIAVRPDKRIRDLSNLLKATEDALVAAGVIRDDSDAASILLAWSASAPDRNGGVSITLEAA